MICVLTNGVRPERLLSTLADVESSARGRKAIVVDGDFQISRNGWEVVHYRGPKVGRQNKWVFWECLRVAAAADEDLVYVEDDASASKSAFAYIERFHEVPSDCAFASYYSPTGELHALPGHLRQQCSVFAYAVCLKVPLRTVKQLLDLTPEMEASRFGGCDDVLRALLGPRKHLAALHYPSLVQHVGDQSTVSDGATLGGDRSSRNWRGRGFDALSLANRNLYY